MEEHSIREREASGHSLSLYSGAGFAPDRAQLLQICRVTDHSPVQRRGNLVCPEGPRHRLGGASGCVLAKLSNERAAHPVNQRPRDSRVKIRLRHPESGEFMSSVIEVLLRSVVVLEQVQGCSKATT